MSSPCPGLPAHQADPAIRADANGANRVVGRHRGGRSLDDVLRARAPTAGRPVARLLFSLFLIMASAFSLAASAAEAQTVAARPVTLLRIADAIGPANADYLVRGIAGAAARRSQLVVIQMDTPGGLDSAMRDVIQAILASPIPVATYVAPSGARAASAGTYILYASHIAAMAPGTNLGAATPVALGGPGPAPAPDKPDSEGREEEKKGRALTDSDSAASQKQINDSTAYLRGLAQLRGRNVEWAERAVRQAASLSARETLAQGVIEHIAPDLRTLLRQLDGQTIASAKSSLSLQTAGAPIVEILPDWRTQLLAAITNPNIALLLLVIGFYGILFEFLTPGFGLPGAAGGICLLLGLYALQLLPVNYVGLALILLGLGLMVAEAFLPSFGALGAGGVAAFVGGGLLLMDTQAPGYGIPLPALATVGVFSAVLLAATVGIVFKTRRLPIAHSPDRVIGEMARVELVAPDEIWVQLQGALWRAESDAALAVGQFVSIIGKQGLVLQVVPADDLTQGA